jgi:transposase-like protein
VKPIDDRILAASWRRNWERVIPFFVFPMLVRKVRYTTNAIESLHLQLRKIVKNRGHFPSDEAAIKLLYLALTKIEQKWRSGPAAGWKSPWRSSPSCSKIASRRSAADGEDPIINRLHTQKS